jgi:hypothetical protein
MKAMTILCLLAFSLFVAPNMPLAADEQALSEELLALTDEMRVQLDQATEKGLVELAAVNLPVDPPGDCNHYGWPIATMTGDTIVVMHRRIPGHNPRGAGGPHAKMSYGIVLHSDDGGKTWSQPYDLRDGMKPEDRNRGGVVPLSHRFKFDSENKSTEGFKIHLHAIGTTRCGGVYRISRTLDTPKLINLLKLDTQERRP